MRYGSVCSGIEAATAAWHGLGWQPAFFSEIEEFPRAVLAHHYPDVPLHGDFTTIEADTYEPIDLLVGGTPCQAFSVAGLRKGFDDERGNLTLEFVRLAQRLRPRWLVWENVPGVLSIDGGRAFGAFLGGLADLGYGFAYRVLDAQYFGVPQRRRRVFVVGCLGDWRLAAAVLFERQSLSGDTPPRRETGETIANALTERADRGSTNSEGQRLIARCVTTREGQRHDPSLGTQCSRATEDGTGRGSPLVPVAFDPQGGGKQTTLSAADVAPTLYAGFGKRFGLENQHIDGGAGLFVANSKDPDRPRHETGLRNGDTPTHDWRGL